jgi:hypothetical protein
MSRLPFTTWIVVVSLIAAIVVWIGYAYRAVQPDVSLVTAKDQAWLVGIVLFGCALDALVAIRLLRWRIGIGDLTWLGLRGLMSIVGFLFVTFPFYAIAFFVLTRTPRPDPRTDPDLPHAYRPISAGWFGAMTPLWWSRNILGASQIGQSLCVVCRQGKDALIHAPEA